MNVSNVNSQSALVMQLINSMNKDTLNVIKTQYEMAANNDELANLADSLSDGVDMYL